MNTIRFYEEMGFLTTPERSDNGYRQFTNLHMKQCKLIRLAMRAEVLQNGLREQAILIVRLAAKKRYEDAIAAADSYQEMIASEIERVNDAIRYVESNLKKNSNNQSNHPFSSEGDCPKERVCCLGRKQAASILSVTEETVRTWERSGLVSIAKDQSGHMAYLETDIERLNMIRTLRSANYSLSAILRLVNYLERQDEADNKTVEYILNTPEPGEEIVSVCDRLIQALSSMTQDAIEISLAVENLKK